MEKGAESCRKGVARKGEMARPEGFEPPAPRFVVWCSIQLSYGRALAPDPGPGEAAT